MLDHLKSHLSNLLSNTIIKVSSISGGNISEAFLITTENQKYFLKTNIYDKYNMFKLEVEGLQAIANTNTITTPKIYHVGTYDTSSYLIMEWIETKSPTDKDFENLGKQLAELHKTTTTQFGFDNNNYIGSLNQSNNQKSNWKDFYIKERLIPQLNLAKSKELLSTKEIPKVSNMQQALEPLFQNITPSLLHGDLWSGNYFITSNGTPYLIDPAIYYGHNEVDIAMTKLFGGFSDSFYEAYFDRIPYDSKTNQRIEIYQLYYLLVHLNLFGRSYYGAVQSIMQKFF